MKPSQVLEMQEDLRSRLTRKGGPEMFGTAFVPDRDITDDSMGPDMARLTGHHVSLADAYRVTEEMCDTVAFAAAKLDDSDVFDRTLAPTPWGFVRFDKPLPMRDVRGRTMLANWLVWGMYSERGKAGAVFSLWNDMVTHPDEASSIDHELMNDPRVQAIFGRWGFIGAEVVANGKTVGSPMVTLPQQTIDRITADGDSPTEYTNALRYVHALWLMLGQTITDVRDETQDLTKKQAARIRKAKIPGKVSVVRLRRVEYGKAHEESHVEWSRRWLVRGHWRWQPCGEGRKDRVRIWISPFVKGPEGAPLIVPTKVYSLDR